MPAFDKCRVELRNSVIIGMCKTYLCLEAPVIPAHFFSLFLLRSLYWLCLGLVVSMTIRNLLMGDNFCLLLNVSFCLLVFSVSHSINDFKIL